MQSNTPGFFVVIIPMSSRNPEFFLYTETAGKTNLKTGQRAVVVFFLFFWHTVKKVVFLSSQLMTPLSKSTDAKVTVYVPTVSS